jgi:hypothetical protein
MHVASNRVHLINQQEYNWVEKIREIESKQTICRELDSRSPVMSLGIQ